MNYRIFKSVITTAVLCTTAVPYTIWAEENTGYVDHTLTSNASATQRDAIASSALRALRHITQARNAIHKDDIDQAREEVQQAREMLALVDAARPTVRLKEHIWVVRQHMGYETAQDIIDDLTLIDAELLRLDNIMPTAKARRHLHSTQALMLKNNTRAAMQELDRLEASLIFTEFDLPLATSEQQILAAQEALVRNRPAAADKNLVGAEESIQFITLSGSAPLASTRMHLSRAAKNYADEYYAAARADLAQASKWLRRASIGADEKSRKEAQKLATEIESVKDRLGTDDHAGTLGKLLHRSETLIKREAEDLWLRYQQQSSENRTLRKLLDAKTHLHYARHDLARNRDSDTIRKELDAADHYLEESLSTAESPTREQIVQLRKELGTLEGELDGDRKQAQARYEQVMANLLHLIHEQ